MPAHPREWPSWGPSHVGQQISQGSGIQSWRKVRKAKAREGAEMPWTAWVPPRFIG